VDCDPPTARQTFRPGPRCATHMRERKNAGKDLVWEARIIATYGIDGEEYRLIYDYQGGKCAICQRANGKTRRLAIDHSHKTGEVRMLACSVCNSMLGHLRDDPAAFRRAAHVLEHPPARDVLGVRIVPGM
jgi:hypothetical protein